MGRINKDSRGSHARRPCHASRLLAQHVSSDRHLNHIILSAESTTLLVLRRAVILLDRAAEIPYARCSLTNPCWPECLSLKYWRIFKRETLNISCSACVRFQLGKRRPHAESSPNLHPSPRVFPCQTRSLLK